MEWITTTQVLEDLKGSNDSRAWNSLRDHFYPAIYNFAMKLGLSAAHAEDAAQETMYVFIRAFRTNHYDRQRGRLSNWIYGVARNVIRDLQRRLPREHMVDDKNASVSFWEIVEDERAIKHTWETEWKKLVLERCMFRVRKEIAPKVFEAFQLYALQQRPVEEVSERLGMSHNAVYIAKNRVLAKLRKLQQKYEDLP